jgi:hypothetical protein
MAHAEVGGGTRRRGNHNTASVPSEQDQSRDTCMPQPVKTSTAFIGIWIEKRMKQIIPGFIPSEIARSRRAQGDDQRLPEIEGRSTNGRGLRRGFDRDRTAVVGAEKVAGTHAKRGMDDSVERRRFASAIVTQRAFEASVLGREGQRGEIGPEP